MTNIDIKIEPNISDEELNTFFSLAWENHLYRSFNNVLQHSLTYLCAYDESLLVGFVNIAWDGGIHAFVLDPTVHPKYQRQGIGRWLIQQAAEICRSRGVEWLHVDYEPYLHVFYRTCGFRKTAAGLINLKQDN